jgi:hypothetical protein
MHDQYSSKDYAGWVGDAGVSWAPTSKLQLTATAASSISVYQSLLANYARNNSLSFTPTYACTSKILVSGSASISEREVVGGFNETDTIENASLGVDWMPRRYVSLGAKLQKMSRTSTTANKDFSDLMTILTANVNF